MKIARAVIENFRHIEKLELDFTDSLDRVRDLTLLVGPNACGKTTVLDALAAALGPSIELPWARPGFDFSPRGLVRRGALYAKVTCHVRFSADEIAATQEAFLLAEDGRPFPNSPEVTIVWQYPDPHNKSRSGYTFFHPKSCWKLFKGRVTVARMLRTGRVDWHWFKRVGGIFTFDQQRTGMDKTIPREIWNMIHGFPNGEEPEPRERRTTDPRTILLSLAMQSLLPSVGETKPDEAFQRVKEQYAKVCMPHQIIGPVRDESGVPDVVFSNGKYEYRYDGLSSGEQMLLLFLIRMATEHIHQSVVLVDEVELHQHPVWQRKLLHTLGLMGDGNQVIATTHSPYLREVAPRGAVKDLGTLEDVSKQEANAGPAEIIDGGMF